MGRKRVADMTPEERHKENARRRATAAAYRATNPEKLRAQRRAWRAANLEKMRAVDAAYRAANLDKINARLRAARASAPENHRAANAAYRAKNLEKIKAADAAYRAANPETKVRSHLRLEHRITDPPPELVELIVTLRKLKRALRGKANE